MKITFIDGEIKAVEEIITQLDSYLIKKRLDYLIVDFPIPFNQYGCSAIHDKALINQFLLAYLSVVNFYFAPNFLYFIKSSFYQYFLVKHQLIYTYLTLKENMPEYSMVIIDEEREKYRKINNLLNYKSLYLNSNEDKISNLLKILSFLQL